MAELTRLEAERGSVYWITVSDSGGDECRELTFVHRSLRQLASSEPALSFGLNLEGGRVALSNPAMAWTPVAIATAPVGSRCEHSVSVEALTESTIELEGSTWYRSADACGAALRADEPRFPLGLCARGAEDYWSNPGLPPVDFGRLVSRGGSVYWIVQDRDADGTVTGDRCQTWRFRPGAEVLENRERTTNEHEDITWVVQYGYRYQDGQLTLLGPSSEPIVHRIEAGGVGGGSLGCSQTYFVRQLDDVTAVVGTDRWYLTPAACERELANRRGPGSVGQCQ